MQSEVFFNASKKQSPASAFMAAPESLRWQGFSSG
jgi:hypothetical protein